MKTSSLLTLAASAVLITSATATFTIDWVTVGNAGNAADTTGYGAVGYNYQIGKYEVTNAQYGAFLSAAAQTDTYGLYNTEMASYGITQSGSSGSYIYSVTTALANRPVVHVSWFDAARMANWMISGNTETGAYTLNGAMDGIITKNAGAQVYIPTQDEWYKAAYYNGSTSTYSLYPNGQNTITGYDANYHDFENNIYLGSTTDVGTYIDDPSTYGTFDQGGNVWEWNDAVINGWLRGFRGGSWGGVFDSLASEDRNYNDPSSEFYGVGFRLASSVAAVPEPSAMVLTALFGAGLVCRRKR